MNFFRRIDATFTSEVLAAQVETTSRTAESAATPDAWIPAPDQPEIWAAFTAIGNSNGVIDHDTAALFVPDHNPQGEN